MNEHDRRAREAKRDLDRVSEEGSLFSTPRLKARTRSLRGHFAARDADANDPIEVWGTRVARGLAAVAFAVLVVWLFLFLGR